MIKMIIITQRFYRQSIMGLQVIANFSNMSNLREDDITSGATDYDGACLMLLLAHLMGKGNMSKPALAGGLLEGHAGGSPQSVLM